MVDNLLPQYPYDGQVYIDYSRDTRWVYNKSNDLWERQGVAESPEVASSEIIGYLNKIDKAFIDTIQTDTPGSFSIIVDPKAGLTGIGADGLITGNITLVSDSIDITCSVFTPVGRTPDTANCSPSKAILVPDGPTPPALNFSLSDNFLNSLTIDLPGSKGDTGPTGLMGPPGKHGFDYLGPPGVDGRIGLNGKTVYNLNGILYRDLPNELSDSAIVDLNLLGFETGGHQMIFTKSELDVQNGAANKLSATLLQRYLRYPADARDCNEVKLSDWLLQQPTGDYTRLDLTVLRLPTGSKNSSDVPVQFDSSLSLSDYIEAVVNEYQTSLNNIDLELGARAKEYITSIDNQARKILADLSQKLSDAEFSLPAQDFCLTFACGSATKFPETPPPPPKPTPTPTPSSTVTPTPLAPPEPPTTPTPVFPPAPPPTPVVPPPYVPTPSPTPLTPSPIVDPPPPPSPRGARGTVPAVDGNITIANSRVVTLNNKNWFYLT